MGVIGAVLEPLVVVTLLVVGAGVNHNPTYTFSGRLRFRHDMRRSSEEDIDSSYRSPTSEDGLLDDPEALSDSNSLLPHQEPTWRKREVSILWWKREITTPNTRVFEENFHSRLLRKWPFLVEAWYWFLIYAVYQLARAFTATTLDKSTVDLARDHALQLIHLEKKLHILWELPIQHWFLERPLLMLWTNRIYSFIHIPGTIAFLVWLYYYTTTSNQLNQTRGNGNKVDGSPAGPRLYEARRRTMAMCNLIAFIVFTVWPCMPPRLLSDKNVKGPIGQEARSYGFIDTVHGEGGESSVWTQNRFCNQYAAMPSLHFGYSLLIGLTIMSIPLAPQHQGSTRQLSIKSYRITLRLPSFPRIVCVLIGVAYPTAILFAIISTANHFILDAVAGATVCVAAWNFNSALLVLLPLEDYFHWCIRIHKPEKQTIDVLEGTQDIGYVTGKVVTER